MSRNRTGILKSRRLKYRLPFMRRVISEYWPIKSAPRKPRGPFPPGGRGLPYKKDRGTLGKFWKEPLRGTIPWSCFVSVPPILKQHIISDRLSDISFRFNSLKGIARGPAVHLLRIDSLRGTKQSPFPRYFATPGHASFTRRLRTQRYEYLE